MILKSILFVSVLISTTANSKELNQLYKEFGSQKPEERILKSTTNFINTPTGLDPLGEGQGLDPKPLFSFRKFDCTTYVETNLAIAFSWNVMACRYSIAAASERPARSNMPASVQVV